MAYREQAFIERSAERCFCDVPVTKRCRCCRRPRCEEHREQGLCTRCRQAIDRRRSALQSTAWWIGGIAGVVGTLTMFLLAMMFLAVPLGALLAVGAGLGAYRVLVARTIKELRPSLSVLVGELPAPSLDETSVEFPPATTNSVPLIP